MFRTLSNIVSGKNLHVNNLYEAATKMVAPHLPGDMPTMTMFFMLQRGADRLIYNNGGNPILTLDVRKLEPDAILQLMDLQSGFMRSFARSFYPGYFDYLDRLANQILPETAANSLALYGDETPVMEELMARVPGEPSQWQKLTYVFASVGLAICPEGSAINETAFNSFVSEGENLTHADILTVVSAPAKS
jgi:hypothetical protein